MGEYMITDEMFYRTTVEATDYAEGRLPEDLRHGYPVGSDTFSKHDSVAALIAYSWSLDPGPHESCGDAQYGNGHHTLFRDERVVMHENNEGSVTAWRVPDDEDVDEAWAEIEKNAVYPDQCNNADCEDLSCENFDCGQEG